MLHPNKTSETSLGSEELQENLKSYKKTQVFFSSDSYLALVNLHAPMLLKAPHFLKAIALDYLITINSYLYTILVFPFN